MRYGSFDSGFLRTIYVNGLPLAVYSTSKFFITQNAEPVDMVQGGGRSVVYKIDEKRFQASLTIPLYVNSDGVIDDACREIIKAADNPFYALTIHSNFGVNLNTITALLYHQTFSTNENQRLTLKSVTIKTLTINVPNQGGATLEVTLEGLPDPDNENDYDYDLPIEGYQGYMGRQVSRADTLVTMLQNSELVYGDDIKELSITFNNTVEPLFLLSREMIDWGSFLYLGSTKISGSWSEAVRAENWMDERETYHGGGYAFGNDLNIYIADLQATILDVLYQPEETELAVGLLNKKTDWHAMFRHGSVEQGNNTIFENI